MTATKTKLVFFGTGPVSLACLEGIATHFELEAIITKPDAISPHGKPHPAPVKAWAQVRGIPLHQPASEADLIGLIESNQFQSQLGLVVDYGFIIPEQVINAFSRGIVNSHFSLLPQWRGADPITFAILSGQSVTGVSLMVIVPALDEGDLITSAEYKIPRNATTEILTIALSNLSNQLLIKYLPKYAENEIHPTPQDPSQAPTYSRKLTKADGRLDWSKPAVELEREIRAFLGWPGSRATIAGSDVIITAAECDQASGPGSKTPGTAFKAAANRIGVATSEGTLLISRLKPAGKRDMTARDFLSGHKL